MDRHRIKVDFGAKRTPSDVGDRRNTRHLILRLKGRYQTGSSLMHAARYTMVYRVLVPVCEEHRGLWRASLSTS
jgi:hypothetical protein